MITICLIAIGLTVLVFLQNLRGTVGGHEDKLGFHEDSPKRTRPRQGLVVRFGPAAPAADSSAIRASPWLQLRVHGQDEIDLMAARAAIRLNRRFPV